MTLLYLFPRTLFGPSSYTNHQVELFKLHQHTKVYIYQAKFEKLYNCVRGLSLNIILNYLISSLNPEIYKELTILKPYSIFQAIDLAEIIEENIHDSKPKTLRPFQPITQNPTTTTYALLSSLKPTLIYSLNALHPHNFRNVSP